jgi:hypothetical protein
MSRTSTPIRYLSPEEALRFVMSRAQHPDPLVDKRELVADRLPQGTRVDSPSFREASQHRAPNGRPLRDLRVSQGVRRPAPSGPPAADLPRGRPADHHARAHARAQADVRAIRARAAAKRRQTEAHRSGVTPAALRKRRERERKAAPAVK